MGGVFTSTCSKLPRHFCTGCMELPATAFCLQYVQFLVGVFFLFGYAKKVLLQILCHARQPSGPSCFAGHMSEHVVVSLLCFMQNGDSATTLLFSTRVCAIWE